MCVLAARAGSRAPRNSTARRRHEPHPHIIRAIFETLERRAHFSTSIPLSNTTWTSIGPAPIADAATGNPAGRVVAIAPHPTDANGIYVASAGGGVWRTLAPATGWSALTDAQATLVMGALAVAPSNPSVIYAGTGEANNSFDSSYGRGILKSTDGGTSWTLLGAAQFDRRSISRIVVDPTDASIVYAAVSGATNGISGNRGIWKSTDGGTSWTNTTSSISPSASYSDLAINPTNPQILYAAIGSSSGSLLNGVYQSADAGATWNPAGDFPLSDMSNGRVKIALAPSSPATLYASIANAATGGLYKMLKSIDGGAHWFQLTTAPNFMGTTGWYDTALIVDPANASIVYAAGASGANSIVRSADGGNTWSDIHTAVTGVSPNAHHHALAFDAAGKLLDGNDGGIWRLDNPAPGTIAWTSLNQLAGGPTLGITQLNAIATHPTSANTVYAGAQANGTIKFNDSLAWSNVRPGDSSSVRIDPINPSIVYHTYQRLGASGTAGAGFLERSDDAGNSWNPKTTGIAPTDPANIYPPLIIAPDNAARLLVGTNRIYESTNRGDTWSPISTPNASGWTTTAAIDAIASAKTDPNTIYATAGGHVFVTTNHGATWTQRDIPGFSDHLRDLLVDATNSLIVYAVRDRFSGNTGGDGHVFRSIDCGVTWTDLTSSSATASGFPDLPALSIDIHPRGPGTADDVLYVGTDAGVYAEDFNTPERWIKLGSGLPSAQITDVEVNLVTRTLTAATYGRGAWQLLLDLPGSITGRVFTDFNADQVLDPNEQALSGVTVYLDADNDNVLDPGETFTTTAAGGTYSFTNLTQGTYNVRQITPAGYACSNPVGAVHVIQISNGVAISGKDFTEFPTTYAGSTGNDVYTLTINPANTAQIRITETIGTTTNTFVVSKAALSAVNGTLTFSPAGGDDTLTVDYGLGVPYASTGGVVFIGGAQTTTAGDQLVLTGSGGADSFTIIQTAVSNTGSISYAQLESISLSALGGNDTISISGAVSTPLAWTAGAGTNTLNLSGGYNYTFAADAQVSSGNLSISVKTGSKVTFNTSQHLQSLAIGPSGTATMIANGNNYLQTSGLTISSNSRLDLNDNDFILDYTDLESGAITEIQAWVLEGYAGAPNPNATGIVSTTAQHSPLSPPILAVFDNFFTGAPEWPPGSGNTLREHTVIAKYTYFGDCNLDGQVTGDDYTIIDSNLNTNPAFYRIAWLLGDANLDGQVSGDDYTTIDSNLGLGSTNPL